MSKLLRSFAAALLFAVVAPACDEGVTTGDEQNATAATGSFETFKGDDGQHYFQLLAKNGARLLRSEGYKSLASAKKGITSVRKNGVNVASYEVNAADNGEFYFNLKATNGQVIGTSELYTTKASAERGVDAAVSALENATSSAAEITGPKFETFKGQDNKTYFRLRAGNGQIILQSQAYSSKSSAEGGISSVKKNAVDATNFEVVEGQDGQHTFRLVASNGKVIGRGEMYASKSGALVGASRVHDIVRELAGAGGPTDAQIEGEIEEAASGLTYVSESDYPFTFIASDLGSQEITEELVREKFASIVDSDPDADKPLADLVSMERSWEAWKASEHSCHEKEDPESMAVCVRMRNFEAVLEANLEDARVYYFGADGSPGDVEGTAVTIFIVGRSADGSIVGVRTLAIWT